MLWSRGYFIRIHIQPEKTQWGFGKPHLGVGGGESCPIHPKDVLNESYLAAEQLWDFFFIPKTLSGRCESIVNMRILGILEHSSYNVEVLQPPEKPSRNTNCMCILHIASMFTQSYQKIMCKPRMTFHAQSIFKIQLHFALESHDCIWTACVQAPNCTGCHPDCESFTGLQSSEVFFKIK